MLSPERVRGVDGTGYSSTVFAPNNERNQSAELRASTPTMSGFNAVIGSNYLKQSGTNGTRAYRSAIVEIARPTKTSSRTYGIFGALNYSPLQGLGISLEGRYQWDQIRQDIDFTNLHLKKTFKSFTPRLIVNYDVRNNLNVYASYSEGRRPGTFNGALQSLSASALAQTLAQFPVPLAVPEEKLTNWEAGVKGRFLDDKLTVLAAAYYGKWRGRQIQQNITYVVNGNNQNSTFILPSGKTDLWGLELQATAKPTDSLTLDWTFDWAATEIKYTNCAECVAINGVLNPAGNRMERYPAFSGSFNARYERPAFDDWTGYVSGQYLYTGKMYDTASNVAWTAPAHAFHSAIGLRSEAYTIEFFIRNMFDNKVPTNILRNTNPNALTTQGVNLLLLAPPERRSGGVRLAFNF